MLHESALATRLNPAWSAASVASCFDNLWVIKPVALRQQVKTFSQTPVRKTRLAASTR